MSVHWRKIGVLLQIDFHVLQGIAVEINTDVEEKLLGMLNTWLNQCEASPTWRALAESVAHYNQRVARCITDRFAIQ